MFWPYPRLAVDRQVVTPEQAHDKALAATWTVAVDARDISGNAAALAVGLVGST